MPRFRIRQEPTVDPIEGIAIIRGQLEIGMSVPLQEAWRMIGGRPPTDREIERGEILTPDDLKAQDAPGPFGFDAEPSGRFGVKSGNRISGGDPIDPSDTIKRLKSMLGGYTNGNGRRQADEPSDDEGAAAVRSGQVGADE